VRITRRHILIGTDRDKSSAAVTGLRFHPAPQQIQLRLAWCLHFRHIVLGPHGRDSTLRLNLRQWGLHLASRGGKQSHNQAIVAVARKLAVLLHRIWITQEPYIPFYAIAA
jgi:hypothetical protein